MKKEELLKGISELLKKHEGYLNSNPEVFSVIEERFFKAIDDDDDYQEDYDGYEEEGDYDGGGYGDDLFDEVPAEDDQEEKQHIDINEADDAEKWLAGQQGSSETGDNSDSAEAGNVQQEVQEAGKVAPKKRSRSGYADWEPQAEYHPDHQEAMQGFMDEGYSHREAERLAGAHNAPTDLIGARKSKVNPSNPSPKMLEHMKELAHGWLKDAENNTTFEADINPIKFAGKKSMAAHDEVHKDFGEAFEAFKESEDVQGLKGRERHKAIRDFKKQWHEDNPEHRENAIAAADAGKHFGEAGEARTKRIEEGEQALLDAGKIGDDEFGSGYSEAVSGAGGEMTPQMAAQMVGGEQNESGGYSTNIKKDPHLVFAENNPEHMKKLREKAAKKLNPEQTTRMAGIDSFKNKNKEGE